MTSRFEASEKNSNTSSSGRGSHRLDSYTNVFTRAETSNPNVRFAEPEKPLATGQSPS